MNATTKNLDLILRSLKAGFTFGPRARCAACNQTSGDPDAIDRGICDRCWSALSVPADLL
jgi:hypothetical protein